jgi:hypothetical protein
MERGAAFLAHYGVKGMRWGVRKQDPTAPVEGSAARALFLRPARQVLPHLTTGAKLGVLVGGAGAAVSPGVRAQLKEADRQIKLQKLDKQWKKQFTKNKRFVDVHNSAADEMDKFLPGHNKKYKDVDFTKPENKAAYKKYEDEYMKEFSKQYGLAAEKIYGTSPTGRSKVTYDHDTGLIKITTKNVKHAAEDDNGDEIAFFLAETDDTGHIIKNYPILPAPDDTEGAVDEIVQSVDLGAVLVANLLNGDELEHYGVKGMRWGVRRETEVTTQTHVDTGLRRRRTRVRTEGGESQPAHHDAVKAAVAKQIVKKSGTDALSTQELRDLANRLQVENQVGILMSSKGKQFVAKEFESGSKKVLKKGAKSGAKVAGPHVLKRAAKPLATAATTAALAL